jgi:hypothetical protein
MSKKIEQYKELLQVLPRTNVKNSREYKKKALIMKQEMQEQREKALKEIKKRYLGIVVDGSNEIDILKEYLNKSEEKLSFLNQYNDSYEKIGLNEVLYDLRKFYKNDLFQVNNDIRISIEIFNTALVTLTEKDFKYGKEVETYMREFYKLDNKNLEKLQETFDHLYWKCPNLFEYINICLRHLYTKNKKAFEKYCSNQIKGTDLSKEEEHYKYIYSKYLQQESSDIGILRDKFLEGILDIKEYDDSKVSKLKAAILLKEEENDNQMNNILKLSYSLYEYKKYLEFKNLIDKVKIIYSDKNNKSLTKSLLKTIKKSEKKIKKANKKINFRRFLFKNNAKVDKFYNRINTCLLELKDKYKEYDEAKFKETIATRLNDNSTLLDALKVVSSFKIDFGKMLKEENEEITNQEIEDKLKELREFTLYPYNNIVNNITISDNSDIVTIILDKYKLLNINITSEQLEDTNIDSLISQVSKILVNHYINSSNLTFENLNDACDLKKVLDSNGQ